jgi:hypothetical protein
MLLLQPEQRNVVDESGMIENSDGEYNRLESGRSYMGRFVLYHPVTAISNQMYQRKFPNSLHQKSDFR